MLSRRVLAFILLLLLAAGCRELAGVLPASSSPTPNLVLPTALPAAAALLPTAGASVALATPVNPVTPAAAPSQSATRAALQPGDTERNLSFDGRTRTYMLHLPPAVNSGGLLPLVIALHAEGSNAKGMAEMTHLGQKADELGLILVYPNGTGKVESSGSPLTWAAWNCCGYALDNKVDDVGFIRQLLQLLGTTLPVDPRRVYTTGFSNGGALAYRLGCELSEKLAAIAPVDASLDTDACQPARAISLIAIHGTGDLYAPYEGGTPKKTYDGRPRTVKPAAFGVSFWAKFDGCTGNSVQIEHGSLTHQVYTGCREGTAVTSYSIANGGHAWPGGYLVPPFGDPPNGEIAANDALAAFFLGRPR